MPKPLSRDATVLFAIFLVSLTFFVLNAVFGSSRQTITVHATNDGLPLSGLELRLMVSGRDCGADSRSVYRSGTTDAGGVASWSRPITRKKGRRWSADNQFYEALIGRSAPTERVVICAALGNAEQSIFVGEVEQYERRLNVTCDLAPKTTERCYGTSPISLDRTLMVYVCAPCWILLAIAIVRSRGRPVGPDLAFAFATVVIVGLTGPLDQFWLLCQVLAVAASLGAIFALSYTLAANIEFRRSNQD